MTSSDEPARAAQRGARTIAAGHLHPGMLFLRLVDGLRQSILPVLIAVIAQQLWLGALTLAFFVFGMIWAVARYVSFRYRMTEEELVTTEGILHRQERRIPVDRIQDLSFESTVLRRALGLVVVSVETASGQGAEAKLDSLSRRDAHRLREVLLSLRGRTQESTEPSRERVLYRAQAGELALLGFTNNRVGAIFLALLGVLELMDQVGAGAAVGGVFSGAIDRISRLGPLVGGAFVAGMLFMLLLAGWFLSVTASLVLYHGFVLTERDDVFQRRFGLLTSRAQSLPRRKIQRVLLEASPLRRLLSMVTVRADSAGSGSGEDRRGPRVRDIVVPMTSRVRGEALVPWLLRGLRAEPLPWNRVSPKVVMRVFVRGCIIAAVLVALGLPTIGPIALVAIVALPIAYGAGFLLYRNLAWARAPSHVAFRWGLLGRYRAFVPLRKVQGVVLRAGPFERALGLASLTVYVAGGSPTTLGYLPRDTAYALMRDVAREAASAPFVW